MKLYLYAAIALALAGLLWHDHHLSKLYKAEKAAVQSLASQLVDERIAKVAEVAHVQENATTTKLRADDPLHGGLCDKPSVQVRAAKRLNGSPSTTAADIQPVPAGDPEPSGQPSPDVRGMLDVLAARGDELSAQVREWQSR